MYKIGMIAGESSGDILGAGLIQSLKNRYPDITVEGIGGPLMAAQGCHICYPTEKLSVMGLVEILAGYPELNRIRKDMIRHFMENPPDVFIGIDSPDFNLYIEKKLKKTGIKTIHYVSPQVWAWREYRIRKIARAVNKILVLLPFEKNIYEKKGIDVEYVGHPTADIIQEIPDSLTARSRLGLDQNGLYIAVMPGSRKMELDMHSDIFIETCEWCYAQNKNLKFITSLLHRSDVEQFKSKISSGKYSAVPVSVFENRSADVLEACDGALLASGTITLEAMLYKKPMVVAYKLKHMSYRILRKLVKVNYVSLPNVLFGKPVVAECLQDDCVPEIMGPLLLSLINSHEKQKEIDTLFSAMHRQLKRGANDIAAKNVLELIESK